jgi:hypothetical protein
MIEAEVGADVYLPGDNSKRLALFEYWLYGGVSEFDPRLAPSIIARSEAELLGISSPRFAIRVHLQQGSFANIRRRRVTARQIRITYDEVLADNLQELNETKHIIKKTMALTENEKGIKLRELESSAYKKVNWIADCLLVPPKRLVDEHYSFLTCSLGADYGEDEMEPATPFVTHISIGGGLCAQAACFMALCLLEHSDIFGISEITLLASDAEGKDELEIHGLKPITMVRFFESIGLAAQLQEGGRQESMIKKEEILTEIEKIRAALRIYVDNKIPVLPMLSASRMQGLRPLDQEPSIPKPIIVSSGDQCIVGSNAIPLGYLLNYNKSMIAEQKDLTHDNHCVVIVGRNKDATSFLLNDPATFPFVKSTPAQLFDARAYRSFARDNEIDSRCVITKAVAETDLGPFQFISVGPKGVNLWLLNFAGDAIAQRGGLLAAVLKSMVDSSAPMGIRYNPQVSRHENLDLHLGHWSNSIGFSFRSGFEMAPDLAKILSNIKLIDNRWYWVSRINQHDTSGEFIESFSFWDASQKWRPGIVLYRFLYCVVARKVDGGLRITFQGEQVT